MSRGWLGFFILHGTFFSIHMGKAFMLVSILLFIAGTAEHSNSNRKTPRELHRSHRTLL